MSSHVVTIQVRPGSDSAAKGDKTYSGSTDLRIVETVPGSSTNFEVVAGIDVSAVQSFFLMSTVDMTIESFNGATPGQTLNLKANVPYLWTVDLYDTFKFTADITKFQCDVAGATAATLTILTSIDATP